MIIDWPAMGYFCLKRLKTCLFSFWNHKYQEYGNDNIYVAFDLYLQWGGGEGVLYLIFGTQYEDENLGTALCDTNP